MQQKGTPVSSTVICAAVLLRGACGCTGNPGGLNDADAGADLAPPVVTEYAPNGALASGTTTATLRVVTDETGTCHYDTLDVPYDSMTGRFSDVGTLHSASLSDLTDGTSYTFYVRCVDAIGNLATMSFPVSFRIASSAGPTILWQDDIQGTSALMGFSGFGLEHPIGTQVTGSDQEGANLSRVANPSGSGYALRHFGVFDTGGSRAQAGLYGDATPAFGNQATKPEGVWVAAELYFPEALIAPSAGGWLSIWDWHSIDAGTRGNRWHTAPGLMIASDGSMSLQLAWGNGAMHDINGDGPTSTIAMPVGRWFDLEMHYEWVDSPRGTIQVWLDGELILEQRNVQTRVGSHAVVETYMKWYGSTFSVGSWQPSPGIRYTRNVRVAGERIWR